ncbi:hypothetical protein Zmor_011453 [Zophobas morio]|uniref:PiggyBac transposable element-derived protein domain-containing protein n=1 Tax=Zophobas morio TaxID=2755281 RepID=A0AA38MKE1_9CUCU|nr:hypothetical protein Zmor_011453 [Zophobas morio]
MEKISLGTRVAIRATKFDPKDSDNSWTKQPKYGFKTWTRLKKAGPSRSRRYELSDTSDSSSSSSSSDEDDLPTQNDTILAHSTKWTFTENIENDEYKEGYYKPKLTTTDMMNMSELDYFELFFPTEKLNLILRYTNLKLAQGRKPISRQELYKFIGMLLAMSVNTLTPRRKYWKNTDTGVFPPAAFGKRFGLGLHRFEEIMHALSFANPDEDVGDDKWFQPRALVNFLNEKWPSIMTAGYKLTCDESMFSWYGKGAHQNGMPAVIKIKRKPKGVGCEMKTLADAQTRIMLQMEINEGKDAMQEKRWQRELGAGTATTLRLTQKWHGTSRMIIGDAWFGSVKTTVELRKRGLYFLGIVKVATTNYPSKIIKSKCPEEKGRYATATAEINNTKLIALAWRDRKVHTFIGSCGTTIDGEPCKKRRFDEEGNLYYKSVKRPKLVQTYFDGAPAIDIHNHIRQSGLSLETVWNTQNWEHRMYASLFGIIETNAFLAYNYFASKNVDHQTFTENLAIQLINGPTEKRNVDRHQSLPHELDVSNNNNDPHVLKPLSSTNPNKQRIQRKCIICSRIKKVQQKASYFCVPCGERAVMCSPQTGRDCFVYHIRNGIPA